MRPPARKKKAGQAGGHKYQAVQRRGPLFLHLERHKTVSLQGSEALCTECQPGSVLQAAGIGAAAMADASQP